jgi:hypothetical protein
MDGVLAEVGERIMLVFYKGHYCFNVEVAWREANGRDITSHINLQPPKSIDLFS